jgi:hypothetical protein
LELEYIFGDKKQEIVVEIDASSQIAQATSKRTRSIEENGKHQNLKMIVAFDL